MYLYESISSCAQYVTLRKKLSHPSLLMYSFTTPLIKLKLVQQIGGELLIANHLDQSLWWANVSQYQLDHIYYTFSCRCTALLRWLKAMATCAIMQSQNNFPDPNRHVLDVLHLILLCRSHTKHRCRCSDTVSTLSLCFKLWSKEVSDQTLNASMKQTSC
jgi:hypothetical protein